jgi:predicted ATP-dependent endonuclease of OLD family
MRIKSVHVKNFRSLANASLNCNELTCLVGANGSGKSAFLKALQLFYEPGASVDVDDFYNRDTSEEIEITVLYSDFSESEKERFGTYIQGGNLSVTRIITYPVQKGGARFYARRPQNPDFQHIRRESGAKKNELYRELRKRPEYSDLPTAGSAKVVDQNLDNWEAANPDKLESLLDEGQFFGFTNVGAGYLGDFTRFIYIPAVRDVLDEAQETKSSAIKQLVDIIIRREIGQSQRLEQARQEALSKYEEAISPEGAKHLGHLAQTLTDTLQTYYRSAGVELEWSKDAEVSLPLPKTQIYINDEGFSAPVDRVGHGLQRAFILSLLQHLAMAEEIKAGMEQADSSETVQDVNLILAIEEPELFQHPGQQKLFSRVLNELAKGERTSLAKNCQVLYATHSPFLVNIEQFEQIRLVRKTHAAEGPRASTVFAGSWAELARQYWVIDGSVGEEYTASITKERAIPLMSPAMNEGFFADIVVLVEGEGDKSAILGMASAKGIDLEALNVAIVSCTGKTNLTRPKLIFEQFGIPVYIVWDGDYGKHDSRADDNHAILRSLGMDIEDWPECVGETFAVFGVDLEDTLEKDIGTDHFQQLVEAQQRLLAIPKKKQALKKSIVVKRIVEEASRTEAPADRLDQIVDRIVDVRAKARG